jgi:hypothetical protein
MNYQKLWKGKIRLDLRCRSKKFLAEKVYCEKALSMSVSVDLENGQKPLKGFLSLEVGKLGELLCKFSDSDMGQ